MITLQPDSATPLVRQVFEALAALIDKGSLRPGARLPSVRGLAREQGISTMTVTHAYQRLVAEAYVEARRGSGYYVAAPAKPQPRHRPFVGRTQVDSLWLIQRVFEDDSALLNAGCGWLPPDWLHLEGVRQALASLARKSPAGLAHYGTAHGYLPLRQQIQTQLAARGVQANPHQLVLTHGATQALALLGRCLLRPRDTVLVDSPGATNFFAALRAMDLRLIGVERRLDGPDVQALATLAQRHRPKAFFTTTTLHNPTGSQCSPTVAAQVLKLAEQHDFHVVENEVMAGLEPPGAVNLAALAPLGRVSYVGSFSKTITPSLRVGFAAVSEDLAEKLVYQKMLGSLTSSELTEKLVHTVLVDGHYRTHLARLGERLAQAQRQVCDGLEAAGMHLFTRPQGGPFVWAGLGHDGVDVQAVAQRAVAEGLMLAPGNLFRPDLQPTPWLRFNVAYAHDPRLYRFLSQEVKRAARHGRSGAPGQAGEEGAATA